MSYESDQLLNQFRIVFSQNEGRTHNIESRLWTLEQFMIRAEPFIKAMELIDPPTKEVKS